MAESFWIKFWHEFEGYCPVHGKPEINWPRVGYPVGCPLCPYCHPEDVARILELRAHYDADCEKIRQDIKRAILWVENKIKNCV